jgi:U3 small nucleolar RNA-associated protein 14
MSFYNEIVSKQSIKHNSPNFPFAIRTRKKFDDEIKIYLQSEISTKIHLHSPKEFQNLRKHILCLENYTQRLKC